MRKIALVTTSRADYGIQARLVRMLQEDIEIDFSLIVSGTHLSGKHGMTIGEIERDGISIAARVDLRVDEDSRPVGIMSRALELFDSTIAAIKPDICVLLGDRYEMLSAALACTLNNIPIAHIHGGEATEGAIDEVFRHSITKASYLHFTSCEEYRHRVIQLGETPERVFNVGALGVENVSHVVLMDKDDLAKELGIEFSKRNFLVTFHPVTSEKGSAVEQVNELLLALGAVADATIVFTRPNADAEGDEIAARIDDFVRRHNHAYLFKSLGVRRYFSMVRFSDAVIGNSSSGILEVPSFGTPTVNIGSRQRGRIQSDSIVNCEPIKASIVAAINKCLDCEFRKKLSEVKNPYSQPDTASRILNVLKSADLSASTRKHFYDIQSC